MKKIVLISLLLIFFACDDGDLQIETLDFDSVDLQTCDALIAEDTDGYLIFKINEDEALILELPSSALRNEVFDDTLKVSSDAQITYRIFDDTVSENYFCSTIPPGTPRLVEEIRAESGDVIISTTTEDSSTFSHNINLSGISLETGAGQRITDLSVNNFGVVTTVVPTETP